MTSLIRRILKQWIPLSVSLFCVCFIIYMVIQQDIRIGAYDPQVQMAKDMAVSFTLTPPTLSTGTIDIAASLSPFTIVYDSHGTILASNALLDGKIPVLPSGVLSMAKERGDNRVTWQPQEGIRLATVVVPYAKGYVLVGRNMREVERREDQQLMNVVIGLLFSLIGTLVSVIIVQVILKRQK